MEQLLAEHVLLTLSSVVLLHHLGVPIPAFPVLIWAGAVAFGDPVLVASAFVLSTATGMAGNVAWYWAGRATVTVCWNSSAASPCLPIPASDRPKACSSVAELRC